MKITINKKDYECLFFDDPKIGDVQNLIVEISGGIKDKDNVLDILYKDKNFFGYKTCPHFDGVNTKFRVYIYQDGDPELEYIDRR